MNRIVLPATLVVVSFSMTIRAASVDFSGNWFLSKLIPLFGAKTPNVLLVIKQTGNYLEVTRSMIDEEKTIEAHYTLDGAENINTESNAAGPVTIRSTSKWNNSTLVLEGSSTFAGPDKDVTSKWKTEYLLSEDGAFLTVTETHPTPFGEAVISQVFSRK
jgi:hypothetical protein